METRTVGWWAQRNPLSYGGPLSILTFINLSLSFTRVKLFVTRTWKQLLRCRTTKTLIDAASIFVNFLSQCLFSFEATC